MRLLSMLLLTAIVGCGDGVTSPTPVSIDPPTVVSEPTPPVSLCEVYTGKDKETCLAIEAYWKAFGAFPRR